VPSLPVPGAHQDLLRVAQLIRNAGAAITDVSLTLDSHQHLDIAHPTFWQDSSGQAVAPFTAIAAADVRAGRYVPRLADGLNRALTYLDSLEQQGRYQHMVWPVHCEIGSWGHNVHAAVRAAYNGWEEKTLRVVRKVVKGENPWTEHYSAIQAEVPDEADPTTLLNANFVAELRQAERLYVTGEAGSHCVKATVEHLVQQLTPQGVARLVLVIDCMSPVTGFEANHQAFLADLHARGATLATAAEVEQELLQFAH